MDKGFSERREKISSILRSAVELELPYPYRPVLSGRPAAVLILIGLAEKVNEVEVLITRRTEHLETHKGQYAFPGGMRDSGDDSLEATALRETEEEMGISISSVEVFGTLPPIWTPSGFSVTPVIGMLRDSIDSTPVRPNPEEIDVWFWCRLARFRESGVYSTEERTITHEGVARGVTVDVYQIDSHRIWGATGAMLRNFIARLEQVGGHE